MGSKSEEKLSGPDLMEIAKDTVVRISSKLEESSCHGSAFAYKQVMTETGSTVYFLTNLHNFSSVLRFYGTVMWLASQGRPDDDLLIKTTIDFRGKSYSVDKIVSCKGALLDKSRSFYQDFAVFSVDTDIREEVKMFALPEASDARAGETVYAFGFPDFTDLGITEGIISHVYHDHDNPYLQHQIQHSILINPGNSGGPTVNGNGVAVGMSTWGKEMSNGGAKLSGMNFSVNVAHTFEICRDNDLIEEVSMERLYQHFVARAREHVKYGS
jgi:S1-C subfamily serine protease